MSLPNPGLTPRRCEVCRQQDSLLRCTGCLAVYYCSRDHQLSHRRQHKKGCVAVKRAREDLALEEAALRASPYKHFETGVGHFWAISLTRTYMQARFRLAYTLLDYFGSLDGRIEVLGTVLEHKLDLLRLSRSDGMDVRESVPKLFISLGRDQEAYDFLNYYCVIQRDPSHGYFTTEEPLLKFKNADVTEALAPYWIDPSYFELSLAVALLLVKLRLLLDLRAIQNASRALTGTVLPEIIDIIRTKLVRSVLATRPDLLRGGLQDTARLISKLKYQIVNLYVAIDDHNRHFWWLMFNEGAASAAFKPEAVEFGSSEEACVSIGDNYIAWFGTPGAIDSMKALRLYLESTL